MHKKSVLALFLLIVGLASCTVTTPGSTAKPTTTDSVVPAADASKLYTRVEDDKERAKGHGVAYFAAGCFWGVEDAFKHVRGVLDTTVGFSGGITEKPTYREVCGHGTKHAETVRVVFDPNIVSYAALVTEFLDIHDPTTIDRQGLDVGDQYRSEIYCSSDEERKTAEAEIAKYQSSGKIQGKIVTAIENFKQFYSADDYHQDYFERRGESGCHVKRH